MKEDSRTRRLTVRQHVAAPPQELFDAWLDPAQLVIWMRPGDTQRSKIRIDPREGGELEILMQTPSGEKPHTGEFRVIQRPKRLAFTWNSDSAGKHDSLVTIDFNPAGRGSDVVLTHDNLPGAEEVDGHAQGWTRILKLMAESYAEAA